MGSKEEGDLVILEDDKKLRKLAKILLKKEERLMQNITSEHERAKYLKQCNDAYDKVIGLLDEANNMHKKYQQEGDQEKSNVARELLDYVKRGLNSSMQTMRNCSLRASFIDKIQTHYRALVDQLKSLDTKNSINVRRLAEEVTQHKQCLWEYTNKRLSATARSRSKFYSRTLKQQRTSFAELVERHKKRLGYKVEFEQLEDAQKLKVYHSIIEDSGRAKFSIKELAKGGAGAAVLLVCASLMVWDIFTAEDKAEAVVQNTLMAVSAVGTFAVQVVTETAVTAALAEMQSGVLYVALAGFVAASVAGIIFSTLSAILLEVIFGSGGEKVPDLEGLEFYTVEAPDAVALANQISRLS